MMPSRTPVPPVTFRRPPRTPDIESGEFLAGSDIGQLFRGMLADEAGFVRDLDYLIFYRDDGFAYSVNKAFFLASQPRSGSGAGKWFVRGDQLCIDWFVGSLQCERVRRTDGGRLIKVRYDRPGGQAVYQVTPTFTRALRRLEEEAIDGASRAEAWRISVRDELDRMLTPSPRVCRAKNGRGEFIQVAC